MTVHRGANPLLLTLVSVAAASGCSGRTGAASRPSLPSRDVVLVTIDTLRADHLGCYGYAPARTPTLDGLAARGVRFATAVAHVPLTGPSHASILTSHTPLGHGMRDNGSYVLPPSVRSVAQDFEGAGYHTSAFVSGFPLKRRFGLDRGFETYDDQLPRGKDPRRPAYVERTADRTTDAALRWLDGLTSGPASAPFFLWVHYFDPHAPYEAPAEYTLGAASPYDGEIAFVDTQLGRLLRKVEERSGGGALVLVTSDHGESLGEHGEDTHGIFVYDSTIRVPFLLAGPGVPAGVVSQTVARGIDVAPTLLDYAGLKDGAMEGRSLRRAAAGEALPDAPAYSESLHPQLQYGWAPLHAWRTARFKFIEAPRSELYDLRADPAETHDISGVERDRAHKMQGALDQAMAEAKTPDASREVDAETTERLAALGYIGTGGADAPSPHARDPKDGIGLAVRLGRNGMTVARTEPLKAIRELTKLLAEDPGMLVVLRTRAVAYEAAGQYEGAVRDLRELEKRKALTDEDAVVLGDNLRLAGHLKEATEVLERTSRENPRFAQPWLSLAAVFVQEKKVDEAVTAFRKVLEIDPDHTEALRGLGDLALVQGDLEAAAKSYERVRQLDPSDVGVISKLGVVRMRTGHPDEAIALFRKAVEGDPKSAEALLYLAGALASRGRPAEAVPYFERALAAAPPTTMALNGLGLTRLALGDRAGAARAFRESLRLDPKQPNVASTLAGLGSR
jgi:choline-sulfatase